MRRMCNKFTCFSIAGDFHLGEYDSAKLCSWVALGRNMVELSIRHDEGEVLGDRVTIFWPRIWRSWA